MLDAELKSKINQLWDKFWSGGIANPLNAIEQMSYLLFMKRLEDEDIKEQQNSKLTGEQYKSVFGGRDNCKWSYWTKLPADKILDHVNKVVFPFLKDLGEEDSMYQEYMKDATFIIPTPSLLIEATRIINSMHIKEQNQDTQGDIYEHLLKELTTSGKNGQFRTPRHIIRMMVELADPKFGNRICDPACGTAGFLVHAYEHILKANTSPDLIKEDTEGHVYNFRADKLGTIQLEALREDMLHGYDFDQTMVRISLMNMMMHGITKPNIKRLNTLSPRYSEKSKYNVILANPPFKGAIDESDMSDRFTIKSKKTELLFLELMYDILSSSGKCAVIVPDGVLFGSSRAHKAIRKKILEHCRLDAVISMPAGVFKPYSGVSTGVLLFTRGEPTEKVWFYKMEADGYSLDDKRTRIDGKGDIPDIISKFKNRRKEKFEDRKAKCFYVPIDEIRDNDYDLSINKYQEIEYEEIEYAPPKEILDSIIQLNKKIETSVVELHNMMK